jgi:hypothetical protein
MAKPITISIVGNAGPLKKAVDEADSTLGKLGDSFKKVGIAAAAGFGALAAGVGVAIGKASDLQETISKVGVIFGDANKKVSEFAKSAATTLGQTQQQALDAAATFGIFGKSAGLSGDALADFSTGFTTLASDLASFNNTSPEQAINAIGAALRGESEPLRGYGVLLNDATLKQAALELGIYDGNGALTAQQKILAAQKVIYEQTADAQGDFERTSDGLANKQRILSAQIQNVITDLGKVFLPIALEVATVLSKVLTPTVEFLNEKVFPRLGDIIGKVVDGVKTVAVPVFGLLRDAFDRVRTVVENNSDSIDKIRRFLSDLISFITNKVAPVVANVLGGAFKFIIENIFPRVLDGLIEFTGAMATVGSFVLKVVGAILGGFESLVNGIIDAVNFVIRQVNRLPDWMTGGNISEISGVSFSMPSVGTSPTGAGFMGSPDRLDGAGASFNAGIPDLTITETSGGGGAGGGGGRGGRGGLSIDPRALELGGLTLANLADYGNLESARIADLALMGATPSVVNVTINTVTADENLPTMVVDAFQRYNLIYGPAEIEIAV